MFHTGNGSSKRHGFYKIYLSDFVKKEWMTSHKVKTLEEVTNAPRDELQNIGNKLRVEHGNAILADKSLSKIRDDGKVNYPRLVFDSIRNMGEVEFFRKAISSILSDSIRLH